MDSNPAFLIEAMVPAETIGGLVKGSFDALSVRLEEAIAENRGLFTNSEDVEVGRIATFEDHAIVGTSEGVYFKTKFSDKDGNISLLLPERLEVPIVESRNAAEYVSSFTLSTVDAILDGDLTESMDRIVALSNMQEAIEKKGLRDFVAEAEFKLKADRPWRSVFREQRQIIDESIGDDLQRIRESAIAPMFAPLYDGTIEEEDFPSYGPQAIESLEKLANRLESVSDRVKLSYIPFEEAAENTRCTDEERKTLEMFKVFSEDLANDAEAMSKHIEYAIENEECVMCLGQIHDLVAEGLYSYEVAGKFVESMSASFSEASS